MDLVELAMPVLVAIIVWTSRAARVLNLYWCTNLPPQPIRVRHAKNAVSE